MNIGDAAARVGLPTKTIRYYETIGLLPAPLRSDGNYRVYGERDLRVLQFIQRARALGFSLKEVADLLALWHDQKRASAEVRGLAQRHIAEIDRKLEELRAIRATLDDLVRRCHGDDRPDCPILDDLAGSAEPRRPRKGRAHG
jgi:MerR family copper efflux transcriptional regulator